MSRFDWVAIVLALIVGVLFLGHLFRVLRGRADVMGLAPRLGDMMAIGDLNGASGLLAPHWLVSRLLAPLFESQEYEGSAQADEAALAGRIVLERVKMERWLWVLDWCAVLGATGALLMLSGLAFPLVCAALLARISIKAMNTRIMDEAEFLRCFLLSVPEVAAAQGKRA